MVVPSTNLQPRSPRDRHHRRDRRRRSRARSGTRLHRQPHPDGRDRGTGRPEPLVRRPGRVPARRRARVRRAADDPLSSPRWRDLHRDGIRARPDPSAWYFNLLADPTATIEADLRTIKSAPASPKAPNASVCGTSTSRSHGIMMPQRPTGSSRSSSSSGSSQPPPVRRSGHRSMGPFPAFQDWPSERLETAASRVRSASFASRSSMASVNSCRKS
jgi:hypothetical protein